MKYEITAFCDTFGGIKMNTVAVPGTFPLNPTGSLFTERRMNSRRSQLNAIVSRPVSLVALLESWRNLEAANQDSIMFPSTTFAVDAEKMAVASICDGIPAPSSAQLGF